MRSTMMKPFHAPSVATILTFLAAIAAMAVTAEGALCRCEENPFALERIPPTSIVAFDEQSGFYTVDGVIVLPFGSNVCKNRPWLGFANIFNSNGAGRRRTRRMLRRGRVRNLGKSISWEVLVVPRLFMNRWLTNTQTLIFHNHRRQ